jgi:hypothetical protein
MFLSIRCQDNHVEYTGDISSYLLFDGWDLPVLLGTEYLFPTGTAWSFAKESDDDFYRLLEQSGLLNTVISGRVSGLPSLLCTPFLRKGVPRWFIGVKEFSVATDTVGLRDSKRTPLVVAYRTEQGFFDSSHCLDRDFDTKKKRVPFL